MYLEYKTVEARNFMLEIDTRYNVFLSIALILKLHQVEINLFNSNVPHFFVCILKLYENYFEVLKHKTFKSEIYSKILTT